MVLIIASIIDIKFVLRIVFEGIEWSLDVFVW